ncbi:hypothetical protein GCM10027443_10440 [Pontibacter brevis]
MAVDAAGNSYVTGISEKNGIQRIATVKYAPSGQQLWAVQFEDHSTVVAIATDNTGGVYVTGAANGDYITVRYNATTGAQDWAAHYDGGGYDREDGTATTHQQTRKDLKRLPKAYLPLTSTTSSQPLRRFLTSLPISFQPAYGVTMKSWKTFRIGTWCWATPFVALTHFTGSA